MTKPLRIVLVASFNFGAYGQRFNASVDTKVLNGLIRCGHSVYPFSYRDVARFETPFRTKSLGKGRMNRRLVETCVNIEPDILWMGHSELVTPETLAELGGRFPHMKQVLWYQDPLWAEEKLAHVHARVPYLDTVFVSSGDAHMRPFKTPDNVVAFFPGPTDRSIDRHRNFEAVDLPIDLLFCGRANKDAADRADFMGVLRDRLHDIRFDINGMYGAPLVFGADYDRKLGAARMGLSYSRRNDYFMCSSARLWQLAGNGLLTFSPRVPGMERLFGADEVVYFDGVDELVEQVRRYHADDAARRRVAKAGWERAHSTFAAERVCRYMLETVMREPHSEPYEWGDQVI